MYLLADWYAVAVEPVTPFRRRTPPTVECRTRKTEWGERRRSSPRVDTVRLGKKLRDVKRPACLSVADRRVSKLRPGCVSAMPQACRVGRGARRTPTDRVRTKRRTRSVPWVPRMRRSDPMRRTGRPTGERSTPTVSRVSSDRGDQPQPLNGVRRQKGLSLRPPNVSRGRRTYHSNPPDEAEEEGLITPTIGPCCLRRALSLRIGSIPLGRPLWCSPGLREMPPGF